MEPVEEGTGPGVKYDLRHQSLFECQGRTDEWPERVTDAAVTGRSGTVG